MPRPTRSLAAVLAAIAAAAVSMGSARAQPATTSTATPTSTPTATPTSTSTPTPTSTSTPTPTPTSTPTVYRSNDPDVVKGVIRPAREPSDGARELANAVLWLPRSVAEVLFLTTGSAAGLVEDEQIVPRARDLFFTREGSLGVFPTLFLETGTSPNVGARMISQVGGTATTLRAGYGGADLNVVESRLRFGTAYPVPAVLSLEGLHDRRTGLGYQGVGQEPLADPRNRFRGEPQAAVFRERRERLIGGVGVRPASDLEIFFSTSYTQRHVDDVPDAGASALTEVFEPSSIHGVNQTSRVVYTELAVRYDTRPARRAIATGALAELYAGEGQGVQGEDFRIGRAGGRVAAFLPVYRHTNILSPKLVLDGVAQLSGGQAPFLELAGQPTYRGFDNRRDNVSLVGSVDYRWQIVRFVAARLFVDFAKVAENVTGLTPSDVRVAGGFGIDLHSSDSELGRFAVAASSDGMTLLFSLGVPAGFGDRQHRD